MLNELNEKLHQLRLENHLTQDEVAEKLEVKRQTYGAYERGVSSPDLSSLVKLSLLFNVSTDYLLGVSEYKNDDEKNVFINKSEMFVKEASELSLGEIDLLLDISRIAMSCVLKYRDNAKLCLSVLNTIKELIGDISILAEQIALTINEKEKFPRLEEKESAAAKKYLAFILARFNIWQKVGNQRLSSIYELYINKLYESVPEEFWPIEADVSLIDLEEIFGDILSENK